MNKRLATLVAAASVTMVLTSGAGTALASSTRLSDRGVRQDVDRVSSPAIERRQLSIERIAAPGCGDTCDARPDVGRHSASTPEVDRMIVATPDVDVPATCAGTLACVGSFTVPSALLAKTPHVASQKVATPGVRLPSTCATASVACDGLALKGWTVGYTPSIDSLGVTPPISVSLDATGWQADMESRVGETWSVKPLAFNVKVPGLGSIPVTLFPEGLALPMVPEVGLDGAFTLTVRIGAQRFSETVPVRL